MICSTCNKEHEKLIGELCQKCYYKKYYRVKHEYFKFYFTNKNKGKINPFLSNNKQVNVVIEKQKICSICGKIFVTKGRINAGKTCSLECRKKHYVLYFKSKAPQRKLYHLSHLKERQVYMKKKELESPVHKLAHLLRSNLHRNLLLKFNEKKGKRFFELVNYSYADAVVHLEKQFTKEMNWENLGSYWQVDHIIPLAWFKTEEQFIRVGWRLSNLQPLESSLNLAKQDLYCGNPKTGLGVICL